ncbi:MAG: pyruvate kinase, partial [Bryobacteraceae bacterium]
MRCTKIVATLGPASEDPAMIRALIEAGVNVFRLNMAHGSRQEQQERIRRIRQLSPEPAVAPAILADLQGPKLRLGTFREGSATLEDGAEFVLTTEPVEGTAAGASINYEGFALDVQPGDTVLLADGAVTLRVESSDGVRVRCRVVSGGQISDRKGVNLPGARLRLPALTGKDLEDLAMAIQAGVDLIGLSFVRQAADVRQLRSRLKEHGASLPIVAKIEKPEALELLEEILDEADGVMVARGDLGVELALEKVPYAQKRILREARRRARFAITATQMLESMVENPYPTRAEVSDVANAIYDGTDAVMLSAETSVGRHPVEAARMMARIAIET